MVHNPKHKVHSFRGLLGDGGEDKISLERQNANVAYRIVKFQLFPADTSAARDSLVKIWREKQSSVVANANFSDPDLLGAALSRNRDTDEAEVSVVFDNVLFSRNIYVTHYESIASVSINYYIEIEEVPVAAATLMQLKLGVARKLNLQQD